jgi:hypothetical protein
LTKNDFIWDVLETKFKVLRELIFWGLERKPYRISVPDDTDHEIYFNRKREIEKMGYSLKRSEIAELKRIRKELEDVYDKNGEDVEIDGVWVKANKFINKNKENETVVKHQKSFDIELDESWGLNKISILPT